MATCSSSSLCASFSVISRVEPYSQPQFVFFSSPPRRTGTIGSGTGSGGRFRCSAGGQTGFFTKLGRLIKEKAKSDVEKIFSGGFSKTRNNLAVIDELLLYWNLSDTDRVLDELEEVRFLLFFPFSSKLLRKIVFFFFKSTFNYKNEFNLNA